VLAMPDVAQRIERLGFSVVGSTPDAFAKQLTTESQVWAKVVSAAGLKLK
jgi:tripartite-type tricarboxylate transporter receptor subunit TctC